MAAAMMLDGGDILRLFAPNGFGLPGKYLRFKDWLEAGSYVPSGPIDATSFILKPHKSSDLTGALTEEFCASALSCIESMIEVERGSRNSKALAWPAIEAYYSSFFAAHTFMRFFGTGCTWLTTSDMGRLKSVAKMHGVLVGTGPRRGQWKYSLLQNGDISFDLAGATSGGGAHDVVWNVFSEVLDNVLDDIANSEIIASSDAVALTLLLSDLKTECKSTSNVRNGVNYRREYGVWFPYSGFDRKLESALKNAGDWKDGNCASFISSSSMPELISMFNFAYIMARICISLSRAGAKYFERHGKRFSNGPLKLCAISN